MMLRPFLGKVIRRVGHLVDPWEGGHAQPRTCPICGTTAAFIAFGGTRRLAARCPTCKSLERHRLMKLMLDRRPVFPSEARMLHFAPEAAVTRFVRPFYGEYVTTDYMRDDVDLKLNIEALDLEDSCFDAVICMHVLEHVDDIKALPELFRILRPGGVAILGVPITEGWDTTYENPEIQSPAGRTVHFGQRDHVRRYGRDFRDRIRAAGFSLDEFVLGGAESVEYSVLPGERIFLASKPAGEAPKA